MRRNLTAWATFTLACLVVVVGSATAAEPGYRTPGYPGISSVPAFPTSGSSSTPGPPVQLGPGYRPHLLVDAAGTAHIVFSTSGTSTGPAGEEVTTAGADHYCRLPRGASQCSDTATFTPPETYGMGDGDDSPFFQNLPGFNTDIGEGARPLVSGNSLLILMHRANNTIAVPGGDSDDANFLYSSSDGGRTFTGPGIVGTLDYDTGAVVYGTAVQSIGVLGTTETTLSSDPSDEFFQGTPAGAFAPATQIAKLAPTVGTSQNESLELDGANPVASFNTISSVTVREYSGSGDINDPATWSQASVSGTNGTLAGGSHGAWLAYDPIGISDRGVVVKLVDGRPSGRGVAVFPPILAAQDEQITEDADGGLTAAWVAATGGGTFDRLMISTSSDGVHWSAPRLIAQTGRDSMDGLQIATAPDGGGFALYVHGPLPPGNELGGFSIGGSMVAVPFGPSGPTGQKGLGGLAGGAGTTSGCLDVRFGVVHAHVDSGCFLQDPDDPTQNASIAYGGVHVNGLELRPDAAGTAIVINPRTGTIDSVHGTVSILLQTPGVPDIKLWDGSLHAYVGPHPSVGDLLFALPMTSFHGNVLGFAATGTVDVLLGNESVRIPMALTLPAYMHSTGQATLIADMANDLERSSLHITAVPDLEFTGLQVAGTSIDYTGPAEQWTGTAELNVPAGSGALGLDVKGATIAFDHGDFASGSFNAASYPGTPIYHNAYLANFAAGYDLHPAQTISGDAELAAVAQGSGGYALQATGPYSIAFGNPSVMTVAGHGAIEGVPLTNARATFSTAGTFTETASLGFDVAGVSVQGSVAATASLGDGAISGDITGSFSVFGEDLASKTIPFSNQGFGVCKDTGVGPLHVSAGFVYQWSGSIDVSLEDCDSDLASASTAQAAAGTFPVVAGSDVEELTVHGAGSAPSVVLTSPSGQTVVPSTTDTHAAAVAFAFPSGGVTAVAIRRPAAGLWHVAAAAGSSAIASVTAARGYPPAAIHARVTGTGQRRTLTYSAALHPGLTVTFAELRAGRLLGVIGSARASRGRIAFHPAEGPSGSRQIVALLSGSGTVPATTVLTTYSAPSPARPGRAALNVSTNGRQFVVRVSAAPGAARYLVAAVTAGGQQVRAILGSGHRMLDVPAAGWADHVAVTVTPLSADGQAGPTTRASRAVSFTPPRYHAPPAPKRRRRR